MKKVVRTSGIDGAHWGITDWYADFEQQIQEALNDGSDFTTDWYASKKEIASGKLTLENGVLTCEASVSNDFDCYGNGKVTIPYTTDLDMIREALNKALDEAGEDQKENQEVCMYSIHAPDGRWVNTYLMDQSEWVFDSPPGDEYDHWGWEYDLEVGPPENIREKLEDGMSPWTDESTVSFDGWEARRVE